MSVNVTLTVDFDFSFSEDEILNFILGVYDYEETHNEDGTIDYENIKEIWYCGKDEIISRMLEKKLLAKPIDINTDNLVENPFKTETVKLLHYRSFNRTPFKEVSIGN